MGTRVARELVFKEGEVGGCKGQGGSSKLVTRQRGGDNAEGKASVMKGN